MVAKVLDTTGGGRDGTADRVAAAPETDDLVSDTVLLRSERVSDEGSVNKEVVAGGDTG